MIVFLWLLSMTFRVWGLDYSPCPCGISFANEERIVGGQAAEKNEYPWMASLSIKNIGFFCGGSLINDRYVLTAAHCVEGIRRPRSIRVRVGGHNNRLATPGNGSLAVVVRRASRLLSHPGYQRTSLSNDVALVQMDKPVVFGRSLWPICLLPKGTAFSGQLATVVGWGRITFQGQIPRILRELRVRVLTNRACQSSWRSLQVRIQPSMICTDRAKGGVSNMGTCNGDSGGPLMVRVQGRWAQIGLVSFGVEGACGDPQVPDVYTRITNYYRFIRASTADAFYCSL